MSWRWDELDEMDRRRGEAWEQQLLADDRVRERRMLDDEERRMMSVFEVEWELTDEGDDGDRL